MADEELKMDEKDLERIKSIQEEFDKLTYELGKVSLKEIEAQKSLNEAKSEKSEVESKIEDLRDQYDKLTRKLHKKYGSGLFDSRTGEKLETQ